MNRLVLAYAAPLALAALAACSGSDPAAPPSPPGGDPPPAPQADAFGWTGNTRLRVFAANGLLANDPAGTAIASADALTAGGGAVAVDLATGAFTYDPPLGLQNATDTFAYTVTGFDPVTVTISLVERVWYVRNTDLGADQGNDRAPFHTLAQAEAASDADDSIFVFAGNAADPTDAGQDGGIALKPGQRLLGEGVGLSVNGIPVVDPFPPARISNRAPVQGRAPVVLLATRNEVAGFTVDAAFDEGILGIGGEGHDIHDNEITFDPVEGGDGIRLASVGGTSAVVGNVVTGSPGAGIAVANDPASPVAATVTLSRNTVTDSAGNGISVDFDGSGNEVTLHVLSNGVAGAGAAAAGGGIDVQARGGASLTAVVSRNAVSDSAAEGVRLDADGASTVAAFVANNALSTSGAPTDFRAGAGAGSGGAVACLELLANRNATADSTFRVDNGAATFRLFEAPLPSNDTAVDRTGTIEDVPEGACGVPLPGAALFLANCVQCHTGNGLGSGNVGPNVTGATAATITAVIAINPVMQDIRLTPQEIQAIAGALAP